MKASKYLGNPKSQPVGQKARQLRQQQASVKAPKKAK